MPEIVRKIALDAMGSDHGPEAIVDGALAALDKTPHSILLVGKDDVLARLLRDKGYSLSRDSRVSIVPAPDVISMHASPSEAVRIKTSSIYVAAELARQKQADGLVSAGNTGATMAVTKLRWRSLPGVSRPGIAAVIPSQTQPCILVDVGANVDCKPRHLFHFAIMGAVYAKEILHLTQPRIGLLSIGEEQIKGNAQTAAAFNLFKDSDLNFVGNVEGQNILEGGADVIVCDGFVGNVVLKFGEALASHMLTHLKKRLKTSWIASLAALAIMPTLRRFKQEVDPDEFGGAPLLGVNGICIICHGATNPKAIMNAIRVAGDFSAHRLNQQIVEEIAAHAPAPSKAFQA